MLNTTVCPKRKKKPVTDISKCVSQKKKKEKIKLWEYINWTLDKDLAVKE